MRLAVLALLMACTSPPSPPTAPMTPTDVAVTPAASSSATNPVGTGDEPVTPAPVRTDRPPSEPMTTFTVPTPSASASAAPPFPGGPVFDRGAAARALGTVNVQSCAQPGQPTGAGHVTVTFDPSGGVSAASVDGGPFPGTPVGGCIANKFRGASIPPFAGPPVRVGKSFSIQ